MHKCVKVIRVRFNKKKYIYQKFTNKMSLVFEDGAENE